MDILYIKQHLKAELGHTLVVVSMEMPGDDDTEISIRFIIKNKQKRSYKLEMKFTEEFLRDSAFRVEDILLDRIKKSYAKLYGKEKPVLTLV